MENDIFIKRRDGFKKHFKRRKRDAHSEIKKRTQAKNGSGWYGAGYYIEENTGRLKRYPGGSKYLKRQSNKASRRSNKEELLHGGQYKKLFDYWWELW